MPGCPNGADPAPGNAGLQELLQKVSFTATVATLLRNHSPTAWAGFTASLIDVNALCTLNPDPPEPLGTADFVSALGYIALPGTAAEQLISRYMFEWLRYQAFLQFCVCRTITPNPTLNCLHATSVTIPSGSGQIVPLASVTIEPAVYDSWLAFGDGSWRFFFNSGKVTTSGSSGASNWFLQLQMASGTWLDIFRGDSFPEGTHVDSSFTLSAASGRFPRTVNTRIRTNFGAAGQLASLDLCFIPFNAPAPPLPDQPDLPTLPITPAPVCDTTDLCSIVSELARQVTRMAGQLSDVQAAITATDQFETISSQAISGEGELTVALGTRAVSVELTTLGPEAFTSALGRPRGLMRVGSVRWGDGIGYSAREFIDGDRFDRLRPQGALTLSYQLLAGTTGTLRWLG